jgi:hypothetical protein
MFAVTEIGCNRFLRNVGTDVSDHVRRISYDSSLQDYELVHDVSSSPCQLYFHYVKCVVSNMYAHQRHVHCVHLRRNSSSKETTERIRTEQCNCREGWTLSQPDRHCTCNVTLRCIRAMLQRKIIKCYIFWECVCSLTQCACAILSFVGFPAVQYFSILSHKRHDFRKKKVIEH